MLWELVGGMFTPCAARSIRSFLCPLNAVLSRTSIKTAFSPLNWLKEPTVEVCLWWKIHYPKNQKALSIKTQVSLCTEHQVLLQTMPRAAMLVFHEDSTEQEDVSQGHCLCQCWTDSTLTVM